LNCAGRPPANRREDAGLSLIDAIMGTAILLVGLVGVMNLFTVASLQNASQGEYATRTTEFAEDKIEQLLVLSFNDGSSNTAVYPTQPSGGTGLGGSMTPGTTVGGVNPSVPVSQYVDYLDTVGSMVTAGAAAYTRQWSIALDSSGKVKTITVFVHARPVGAATAPTTTLVSMKSLR